MSKFDGPYVLIQAMHQERERIIRALGLPYPPDEGFCQNGYPDLADRVISELEELKRLRADDSRRRDIEMLRSDLRLAFDAGARAMRDALGNEVLWTLRPLREIADHIDITKLPGRPQ